MPPPPMAVRSKNRGGSTSVRGHLWWPAVAKLQAASVSVAQAAAPWDREMVGERRTDRTISKCPLGRGIITNASRKPSFDSKSHRLLVAMFSSVNSEALNGKYTHKVVRTDSTDPPDCLPILLMSISVLTF